MTASSKMILYEAVLKPVWGRYGVLLRGTASNSNTDISERFHTRFLRTILHIPRYVKNPLFIYNDKRLNAVREVITKSAIKYEERLNQQTIRPKTYWTILTDLPD